MGTSRPRLRSCAPFSGHSTSIHDQHGVVAQDRDGMGLATTIGRKGSRAALSKLMLDHFGITLPLGPIRQTSGAIAVMGIGPGVWLTTCEQGANSIAVVLEEKLRGVAAVSDQSDAYAILRLSGPGVRQALSKLVPLDLHPRSFEIGAVAVTAAGDINAILWRLEDEQNGLPVFEMAVFRSLAQSFWHALCESAAEVGILLK